MNKSNPLNIALIVVGALILLGVILLVLVIAADDNKNVIDISLEVGETRKIEFDALCLVPGEQSGYTLSLKRGSSRKYDLKLGFVDLVPEKNSLGQYAYVKIESDGELICDSPLASILDRDDITVSVDLTKQKTQELRIAYYLPEEIGNEAQNAEALFALLLTASNK